MAGVVGEVDLIKIVGNLQLFKFQTLQISNLAKLRIIKLVNTRIRYLYKTQIIDFVFFPSHSS